MRCPKCGDSKHVAQYRMPTGPIWCVSCGYTVSNKEVDRSFFADEEVTTTGPSFYSTINPYISRVIRRIVLSGGETEFDASSDLQVVSVGVEDGVAVAYALENSAGLGSREICTFLQFNTWAVVDLSGMSYVGTVNIPNGNVSHIFLRRRAL